jgi:hypothetical protein
MSLPALRPMSTGEILDGAFQLYRRHFGVMYVFALAPTLVMMFGYARLADQLDPANASGWDMISVALVFIGVLLLPLSWLGLARLMEQAANGGPLDAAGSLRVGARRLPALLGVAIIGYVLLVGVMMLAGALGGIVIAVAMGGGAAPGALLTGIGVLAAVAIAIGTALFFVPLYTLAVPLVVIESAGPLRALRRAHALTKGGRLRVTGVALISWLISYLPVVGGLLLTGAGVFFLGVDEAGTMSTTQAYMSLLTLSFVGALTTPFLVGVMVMLYYDRRVRREGVDIEIGATTPAAV